MTTPINDGDITTLLQRLVTPIVLDSINTTKVELEEDIARLEAHTQEHYKTINKHLRDLADVVERSLRLGQVHSEKLSKFIQDQESLLKQNVAIERDLKKILLSMNVSVTPSVTPSLGSTDTSYTHSYTP